MRRKNTKRLRGKALQQRNRAHKAHNPTCKRCETGHCAHRDDGKPCIRAAEHIDHVVPLYKGGEESKSANHPNLQGLCVECHELKTREDLSRKPAVGLDGWPIGPQPSAPMSCERPTRDASQEQDKQQPSITSGKAGTGWGIRDEASLVTLGGDLNFFP